MPRWFKYTHYLEPERVRLPPVARAQKLQTLLERDPRFADLPNFAEKLRALSPVPSKINTALLPSVNVKGSKRSPRKDLISAVLSQYTEKHLSDPSWRAKYRELRKMQLQSPKTVVAGGGQTKVSPSGGDKRRYNPTGKAFASTIHGYRATFRPLDSWLPAFANPSQVIPCVQRKMRREVMFAKDRAGRGYKAKKRRTWSSGVPC